jgi:hypothetical protein
MASEDRANDADRDGDGLEVSTFGESLSELSDDELRRQAETYLSDVESKHKAAAEAYLGFSESWGSDDAGDELGKLFDGVGHGDD